MLTDADQIYARARAAEFWQKAAPRAADLHLFRSQQSWHALAVNGSQVFDLSEALAQRLLMADSAEQLALMHQFGLDMRPQIEQRAYDDPNELPRLHALSLAIAQKCNLACTYCYAEQGSFGERPQNMDLATAKAAVDLLLDQAKNGGNANLAFLGGEPLANRADLRACTEYAAARASALGVALTYSITSNGTLLTPDDAEFFERFAFAVTISLDGGKQEHDQLRPFKSKAGGDLRGSFDRIVERIQPLVSLQKRMQVSARVTVTPHNQHLPEVLEQFIAMGFHSVGFSPMLRSPTGRDELHADQLQGLLGQMIACGERTEAALRVGQRYPFANLLNALKEIGKGTHRPYPCGAGAGYMAVSAAGELSACHRFVGDAIGAMGTLREGVDRATQQRWLQQRHVHTQSPCKQCWARYLCGGGCHHEVIARGRTSCDYIRGWLQYCLEAYLRLTPQTQVKQR
jgi:uncharacterized protein